MSAGQEAALNAISLFISNRLLVVHRRSDLSANIGARETQRRRGGDDAADEDDDGGDSGASDDDEAAIVGSKEKRALAFALTARCVRLCSPEMLPVVCSRAVIQSLLSARASTKNVLCALAGAVLQDFVVSCGKNILKVD
jgi:hypothetical protein